MKYHNLVSLDDLIAYKKGKLSSDATKKVAFQIENNPIVKAVAENCTSISSTSVKSITRKTQSAISKQYLSKVGFWTKYGAWIGLSSIVLIVGLFFLFKKNDIKPLYSEKQLASSVITVNNVPTNKTPQPKRNRVAVQTEQTTQSSSKEEMVEPTQNIKNTSTNDVKENDLKIHDIQKNKNATSQHKKTNKYTQTTKQQDITEPSTRNFVTENYNTSSNTVMLAVQNVQILAKMNPKMMTNKREGRSDNPFQSFSNKKASGNNYAMDDVPKFRGGDRALKNYFKGALSPIEIPKSEDTYDRNVLIVLEINSRGKLKNYKIRGNLYPKHQKALEEAINNLPRFSKGSIDIIYNLGISF